ncbi:lanthionine synthetase C family protein [Chitinophaga agrisoli]|uniref:Lanthionine synthetase C family protein n=1 Tax=Chitinophaga agrisoli TaxID=2607653 RepID=A0A5B2VSW8_9BACT|nr:lanthionine synthetase C family protein [Chitinophaga agrisoli]KAA2241357.1 lanthionine synthetase C family protein [Chitinophaga agrisoli]
MDHKKKINKVLQEISPILDKFIEQESMPGLLGGYSGCALFYAYYYHLTGKKKHLEQVHKILLKSVQALSEQELLLSHCSGVSGIAWGIHHLIQGGFAEAEDMEEVFGEVDDILGKFMTEELRTDKYDFLHQGLGPALYFLDRLPQPSAAAYLTNLVQELERSAVIDADGVRWKDHFSKTATEMDQDCFNLGLAHGMPAIVTILGMIKEKGIAMEATSRLLDGSMQFLLTMRNDPGEGHISLYPSAVGNHNTTVSSRHSRLGWCYGDLGIAATLWGTGIRTGNPAWQQAGYDIFDYSLQHRDNKNGSVYDACLCHGAAGISHMYRRAYRDSKDARLLEGANHWLQQTLEMKTWEDGYAGFKFYTHPNFENSHNLLEGITGIGLALIAALDEDTPPAWDRCLLLS